MTMTDERQQLEIPIDAPPADDLTDQIRALIGPALTRGDLDQRVALLNAVREIVAEYSPFATEPVDMIRWVPADSVQANDYNPNAVAPPEMELLRLSIMADGYTQPIVTNTEDDARIVVDGFHRNRVGKECADVRERIHGYLPVVQIRATQVDRGDRIASTIRHNRARGKHQVPQMSKIVLELKRRNWSDDKIGRQLGMDPDEVLRLCQITGLAEAFKHAEFSEAWEAVVDIDDEDEMQEVEQA
jgi:ParB-like chromosome segregation protein Spo0J